jgi:renal tumor antigen
MKLYVASTVYLTLLVIEYRLISKKGEGTFSEVLKAQSIKTGKYVAIKCMKQHYENIE